MSKWVKVATGILIGASNLASEAFGESSKGSDRVRVMEASELALEAWKNETYRNPYIPQFGQYTQAGEKESWIFGTAINLNICVICYKWYNFYWNTKTFMNSTNKQVRQVGMKWDFGMEIKEKAAFIYRHRSSHVLDKKSETNGFYPLKDQFVLKYYLYRK